MTWGEEGTDGGEASEQELVRLADGSDVGFQSKKGIEHVFRSLGLGDRVRDDSRRNRLAERQVALILDVSVQQVCGTSPRTYDYSEVRTESLLGRETG